MGLLIFTSCSIASLALPLALPLAFLSSSVCLPSPSIAITANFRYDFLFRTTSVSVKSIVAPVRGIPDSKQPVTGDRISEVDNDDDDYDEDDEGNLLVGNLPLESKLLQKLEHKMKMKLAKKVRLRRKKLIRKRRMRKKGRWPPSKMNKLKNV